MPFITFEGIDASGKTTQIQLLCARLQALGLQVHRTFEAGSTPLGQEIRTLVQHKQNLRIDPVAEMLLYAADRAQHIAEVVQPLLASGYYVLSDRHVDSSIAFQGAYLPSADIRMVNDIAVAGIRPEMTILLDITVEESRQRLRDRGVSLDRIEARPEAYQEKVRQGYLHLAQQHPERIVVVGNNVGVDEAQDIIWAEVEKRFGAHIHGQQSE